MKAIILSLIFLSVLSCRKKPIETTETAVNGFELELLFEKDGCKVYRFYDGRYVYWSTCDGKIQHEYNTGQGSKTGIQTHRVESITTSK